ncbi:MAG TPA: hypothetical protein VER77_05380 [Candidatus Dormibacteraeota bacterium]|nr:hypothetical protein [Candidatus Dormibacteraeota bacterium]
MIPVDLDQLRIDAPAHLESFRELLSLPRETVPQMTAAAARKTLAAAAADLDLEIVQKEGVTPTFLLLRSDHVAPSLTLFATWHAEAHPVTPAAVEGAERLALATTLGAMKALVAAGVDRAAVVVAPAAGQGSLPLEGHLRQHRAALQAPVAFWPRISPSATSRRRVYLGARGRVVLGVWGEEAEANPYAVRDQLIAQLGEEAYGPRPLDFELLRKLAQGAGALDFLEETLEDPDAVRGDGEAKLRSALFEPRGQVVRPQVRHADRPQAWIIVETAEQMEPADVLKRAQALAGKAKIEMAEGFLWDRLNIHHPGAQAAIRTAKSRSEGAEIWPMAPWVTPSGIFTRALGTPLVEWSIPLPRGAAIRFPSADAVEAIEREMGELFLRGMGALKPTAQET